MTDDEKMRAAFHEHAIAKRLLHIGKDNLAICVQNLDKHRDDFYAGWQASQHQDKETALLETTIDDIEALRGKANAKGDKPHVLQIYDNLHEWADKARDLMDKEPLGDVERDIREKILTNNGLKCFDNEHFVNGYLPSLDIIMGIIRPYLFTLPRQDRSYPVAEDGRPIFGEGSAWCIKSYLAGVRQDKELGEDEAVEIMAPVIMNTPSHPKITGAELSRYQARAAYRAIQQTKNNLNGK